MRPRNSFVCLQMRVHGILVMYGLFDRNECFKSGLTGDLCDWFLRCNDYFIQISNGMVHHFYSTTAVQYSSYADTPVNVTVSMGILSIATNILRILRNMCSHSPSNQQVVFSSGMIRCVVYFMFFYLDL